MREMQSESPDELGQLYRQLWVLTDAIIKSMAQTMCSEQLNKISQRDRFPTEVLEQMGLILDVGVQQIVTKHKEMKDESRCANLAFAYLARVRNTEKTTEKWIKTRLRHASWDFFLIFNGNC